MATKAITEITRGDNAPVYGQQARNRLRAVVDEAVAMVTGRKRRHVDGRDVYEVMADVILADPIGAFAQLDKMLPGGAEKDGKGAALHIGTLYLQAVQQAQPMVTIDHGYTAGTQPDKPLITQEDW